MRLLKLVVGRHHPDDVHGEVKLSLVEHLGRDIPPYAILSHTWGKSEEEVTFKDIEKGRGKDKVGYKKIMFCIQQAARDGLQYSWVDTCCIDKSSSAELQEAINSMFRWYHDAARCYVYMSDVSSVTRVFPGISFQRSRWFTRGWTLQELLAPTSVEFFSSEGNRIGDKASLADLIGQITSISNQALQGAASLSQFGIEERMAWANGRTTTREEDEAYSLLGLFDVHMPLIYGEGRKKAFARLQREIDTSSEVDTPMPLRNYSSINTTNSWISRSEQGPSAAYTTGQSLSSNPYLQPTSPTSARSDYQSTSPISARSNSHYSDYQSTSPIAARSNSYFSDYQSTSPISARSNSYYSGYQSNPLTVEVPHISQYNTKPSSYFKCGVILDIPVGNGYSDPPDTRRNYTTTSDKLFYVIVKEGDDWCLCW